ncbi:nucleotide exchange factor GrpE [Varibaculum sp.]|uniref:nucleotide exchange factor GrpE n=1 Tax=Varibaculum sp. TaxID=1895474 RepID=UPI0025CC295B|nr:nucleotide exchange factor GrpE [Varibaculum sp.]
MKDPMNPASTPDTENNGDSSPKQGSTPQVEQDAAKNADNTADSPSQDGCSDLEDSAAAVPGDAPVAEETENPDENAAFADLAARLGEEINDEDAPVEETANAGESDADSAPNQEIEKLKAQVAELNEQLARSRAEIYNLQQEYSGYVKRSKTEMSAHHAEGKKAVLQVLLSVLDDVQAARDAGDLKGPFEAIAKKMENTLETNFGLTRYGSVGEEFDPNVHEALMAQSGGEGEPSIAQVLQPGYKVGENVLRATKVIVNNPD